MFATFYLRPGALGKDPQNFEVGFVPVALLRVEDGEVSAYLAVIVAEWNGKETLRAETGKPFPILRKHLLNIARKRDDLVVEHALTGGSGEPILKDLAQRTVVPIGEHVCAVGLRVDFRSKRTRSTQGLGQ